MRDPRLLEIDFLMELDQQGSLEVQTSSHLDSSGVYLGDQRRHYGVDAYRFRDLLVGLVLQECIAFPRTEGEAIDIRSMRGRADVLAGKLTAGRERAQVVITHAGRLRLWDLRDALLRDPDVDPMGPLSKAAWWRDLPVLLRWATIETPLSIIWLDLDNFGAVNKTLGHGVGDKVLLTTFNLVKNFIGGRGRVYRPGGEEVGILLPGVTIDAARTHAEDLRRAIEVGVQEQVPELQTAQTASIGVASYTNAVDPDAAADRVDRLMRRAKTQGKNCVVVDGDVEACGQGPTS